MKSFQFSILSASQKAFWPFLQKTAGRFVLYGGTAIALRLGHRKSIDFDFFTADEFTSDELVREMDFLAGGKRIQESRNTLTVLLRSPGLEGPVKISFFGGLKLGRIYQPDTVKDGPRIASLLDLLGMKCAVVSQRAEAKDYMDIHAIITRTSLTLTHGIAAARAIYGAQYNGILTLKALCFFEDGNVMTLAEPVRKALTRFVKACDLSRIPEITCQGTIGEPDHQEAGPNDHR